MEANVTPVNAEVKKKSSKFGIALATLTGGIGLAISVITIPFITPAFRKICLPYVPSTTDQIKNIILALKGRSGSVLDVGSGDGRIVIAAAKAGFQADGIELNPWLVYFSKLSAINHGVSSKTLFLRKNLWKYNLEKYDNIVIFVVTEMIEDLIAKFQSELKPNCSIIVCRFPLQNYKPISTIGEGLDTVWVYKTPLMNNL
ncbi:PREDICTED: protein FAM173B [Ceratosolen solmsi marchali]|uniref:Protein FAM173B n=1 Tax=Ceratosolen solmsi marchali TaxID=326594 RepID=A0AAJ6YG13_9HYME|nr:PREDICTED: protein FAM173B [Ceratosolen solmsi marchali]